MPVEFEANFSNINTKNKNTINSLILVNAVN